MTKLENARKQAAVCDLAKTGGAGRPFAPHLAVGFVLAHPAISSVIIGPRTMDQLTDLLEGADTVLDEDVLDRRDEIVPQGTDLNPADSYYGGPAPGATRGLRRR